MTGPTPSTSTCWTPRRSFPKRISRYGASASWFLNRVVDNFFAETEQVAFCTQNIVPGIDFTNDPLLQGRNFSYLDTQLKRLGSPNFTHIPVNAPKCPIAHFQQDGHMAMTNPSSRVNYEPNSWQPPVSGPREDPARGFQSYPAESTGPKRRLRPESFADHYSQARQFLFSQAPVEQRHLADAFVFELSKCDEVSVRRRMVAGLRNVDEEFAQTVATGLGLGELPEPLPAAREAIELKPSQALSIVNNGPQSFEGRKLGVLLADGVDDDALTALTAAAQSAGVNVEIVAPAVGGVTSAGGNVIPADQKLDGAPSSLYDAVALLLTSEAAQMLSALPPARDFVSDAFAHSKFVAYLPGATELFSATGLAAKLDDGFVDLSANAAEDFLSTCGQLRYWPRLR